MELSSQWWPFTGTMVDSDRDTPGVYEFGDLNGIVVYVGSSDNLRRRLKEHLTEPASACIRKSTTRYRLEYTQDFKKREQELYDAHVLIYLTPPKCNNGRPCG